jgi:PAS domain S-box-containing protein
MTNNGFGIAPSLVSNSRLLAQIVEASADAIFSEDLAGKITSWNEAATRLYGSPATEMLGRSTADLVPHETAGELRSVHQKALAGHRVERFDTRHRRPDGGHVAVSLTVSPLRSDDGVVTGLASSVKDVTDRLQLTEELALAHDALQKHDKAMSRSNRDLEQFAYVASHDLSEPLRAMTGFVQLLEKRYADVLDERGARYLFHIVEGAARMRSLIEDLLEYSRFLSSDTTEGRVDTMAVARKIAQTFPEAVIDVEALPAVWCGAASVKAALTNLVSNAAKFHRPDTTAHIVLSGRSIGQRVELYVDDDGIGIEAEYRERVFGMFSRLHVREAYGGTGIGLAIVQQIAERADGRAWAESSLLGGSRFCIDLPGVPTQELAA